MKRAAREHGHTSGGVGKPPNRRCNVPLSVSKWIAATLREAGWVPALMLLLLALPARVFGVFTSFPGIDIPIHFLGGVATGFFFHRLCLNASRLGIFGPYHTGTHGVLVFGLVCAAAVFWEFGEFVSDQFFGTHAQLSNVDTMTDLLLDMLGGISFLLALAISRR